MRASPVVLLILICGGAGTVLAQAPAEELLTEERCVAIALAQNPLVLSARRSHEASLTRIDQAKAFAQPVVTFDSDLQPDLFNFAASGESYLGLSQTLEFPGKRGVRGKIAQAESNQVLADIDRLRLDLAFQVREAFGGVLLAQERLRYAERDAEQSEDFLKRTELKHAAGDIGRVEVLRAQVEASRAANTVKARASEVSLAKARLNYLLARPASAPLQVAGALKSPTITLDLSALTQAALAQRPELTGIRLAQEREALREDEATLTYAPDLDLAVSRHRLTGEPTTWDVTFSVPVPLYFWQPKRGAIAEARANQASLTQQAEHLRQTVALEVEEAYLSTLAAWRQIEMYETNILKQAEEVYELFAFSYQEGELDGLDLIAARRTLLEVRQAYADALFTHKVALAALNRSMGQ